MSSNGLVVENDRKICGKTPDWVILDTSSSITAVVEMVYHHIDRDTNNHILSQQKAGKAAITYHPNGNDPKHLRLYSQIQDKAGKYKELVAKLQVPYVVAIYIDFLAVISVQEVKDCLIGWDESLFKHYPDLSGVLYFEESNRGSYRFEFIENPYALRKIDIPTGYLVKS